MSRRSVQSYSPIMPLSPYTGLMLPVGEQSLGSSEIALCRSVSTSENAGNSLIQAGIEAVLTWTRAVRRF